MKWEPATVATTRLPDGAQGSDGPFLLSLAVNDTVARGFHVAGQYHRVHVEGVGDAVFAIASPPGRRPFEYLVKRHGHVTRALGQLDVGAAVRVSHVTGKGFPLELAKDKDLLLVGAGSGVAPLRSVVEVVRARRGDFGRVTLLYGVRAATHLAWASCFDAWRREDITVIPTVTAPDPAWTGAIGRVQQHLGGLALASALVFLCGQKQMVHDLTLALGARGVPGDRVFLNH